MLTFYSMVHIWVGGFSVSLMCTWFYCTVSLLHGLYIQEMFNDYQPGCTFKLKT